MLLTIQETSLLFSNTSALRPALPFALITKDCNYIPAHLLQSTTTPPDVEIGKYYYKKHVEEITEELTDALSLGSAAAEEWSKGLDARGKERMKVADNWEKWEARHRQDRQRATSAVPALAARSQKELSRSPARQIPSPIIHTPVPVGKYISTVCLVSRNVGVRHCNEALPVQPNDCSTIFSVCPAATAHCSTTDLYSATWPNWKHAAIAPKEPPRCKRGEGMPEDGH
jgi:hypothetical protein